MFHATHERLILGAAGYSQSESPWLVYEILAGRQQLETDQVSPMRNALHNALIQYLSDAYGAEVYEEPMQTGFTPNFTIEPYLRFDKVGSISGADPGDVLIIELVERKAYDFQWKTNGDITVPWHVRSKANIRMRACGAKRAIVWVVSDMGDIDEFHEIMFDEVLVNRLEAACFAMKERIETGNEPDPSDDDLEHRIPFTTEGHNSVRQVEAGCDLDKAYQEYLVAKAHESAAYQAHKAMKEASKPLFVSILRALDETPVLQFPDGATVSAKTIRKAASTTRASAYQKIIIKNADGSAVADA